MNDKIDLDKKQEKIWNTNILLVNDRFDQLLALEKILLPITKNIIKASSGREALRVLLNNENIAVILLDVKMPDMDGFETATLIRQRKKTESIPIIFVTALEFSLTDQFVGYALGAIDYIFSPIEPVILQAKVKAFIELYQKKLQILWQTNELKLINEKLKSEINKRQMMEMVLKNKNYELEQEIKQRIELENLAFYHKYHLKLAELARVDSMGEMASALAHEFNQPLTAIVTYTQTCIRKLLTLENCNKSETAYEEILQAMRVVAGQAERAGEILHRMKDFIRKGNLFLEQLNVNEVILKLMHLIRYELRNTAASVELLLGDRIPSVYLDKIQIEQVLLNLVRNAIEAMEESKTLNPHITISTQLQTDRTIKINVIDNGPGFSDTIASTLFNPYFTTKKQGTGMGLAISRTIIEAHGGQLSANFNPEQGTCFSITLPINKLYSVRPKSLTSQRGTTLSGA